MFVLLILVDQNWVTWGQKLGHKAKSRENLVNTLEVKYLK